MNPRKFEKLKRKRQRIARERIALLLGMARERALAGEMDLADRYAVLARRIGMRYQVKMPRGFKLQFCRRCQSYLLPARNSRQRVARGRIIRVCENCGSVYRMPLGRGRKDG